MAVMQMPADAKIYVAGHQGLVGSAITHQLRESGYDHLILRSREELDLTVSSAVRRFFATERPQYVFLAAAKVGGIQANDQYPADFIRDNLLIQTNVIDAAYREGVSKLLFLGSSCIYPKQAPQPMKEEHFLTGPLEPTNEWYAIAKIAGIKTCQAYWKQYGFNAISLMPTNLYGPGDNFNLETSHVLPALLRKFHEAKLADSATVTIWGSGSPKREFLYVNDLAHAALHLMLNYDDPEIINVGTGEDISISDLAALIKEITGFTGRLEFDASKPDGTPRKLLDISKLSGTGWTHHTTLTDGIRRTYEWYLEHYKIARD